MKYPEFREAEYSTTDIPVYNREKHYMFIALKCIAFIVIFFIIILITHYFFEIIMLETTEGIYLNAVSVGASIVTVFSALIAVLSLLESNCLKKYDNDLHLLENRYLDGRRISGWEFLHRCSYYTIKSKKTIITILIVHVISFIVETMIHKVLRLLYQPWMLISEMYRVLFKFLELKNSFQNIFVI